MRNSTLSGPCAIVLLLGAGLPAAQANSGVENVRHLAGCFEVTYEFVEDGAHDSWSPEYDLGPIIEWVGYTERADGAHVLPHVSVTDNGRVVPHWHEVWRYHPDNDTWTQTVRRGAPGGERDDVRYRCTAAWTMNRWQCHAGEAPKPFRDSGAPFGFDRADYARIDRENILLVTSNGWVHNEHNRKVTEEGEVVAYELGWIAYRPVAKKHCTPALEKMPAYAD